MNAQILGLDRIPGVTGYLVFNEDGAVINSGGDLGNNESLSEPVLGMLRAIQKGKHVICKDEDFQNIQVYSSNMIYIIFRQSQKFCVVKRAVEAHTDVSLM